MQGTRAAGFLFGTQIRHSESRDERPMPETHQRVPYQAACRPACCPDRLAAAHPSSPAPRLVKGTGALSPYLDLNQACCFPGRVAVLIPRMIRRGLLICG